MKYPEHEKLQKIQDKSQTIGEFLDWLGYEHEYFICEKSGKYQEWYPISQNHQKLLAQYFDINLDKLEQEKKQMLEALKNERR